MSEEELIKNHVKKLRSEIIDELAKVSEKWGLSGVFGRIHGVLIFSNKPMSLDEISKGSGYSVSSISQSIRLLENIGNVKRTKVPRSRKVLFEAERDISKNIQKYMESTLDYEITPMLGNIERTEANYKRLMEKTDDEKVRKEIEEDLIKLEQLKNSYKIAKKYLTILKNTPIDDSIK
ncbi:MAG: GbsR/MarR family transcriptional regulator [Candidatus Hydrothermarchaeales archaeon]